MIDISDGRIYGFDEASICVRNAFNSWEKNDSHRDNVPGGIILGPNDLGLMTKLAKAGNDHGKFLRMIIVYVDILAPLYWWKEFDTYKVGTVSESCSTMHTIMRYPFDINSFSFEDIREEDEEHVYTMIDHLNDIRYDYLQATENKESKAAYEAWRAMIQLLPSSFNQRRTIMLNYAVLRNMYHSRANHKLTEWQEFCDWISKLPYAEEFITSRSTNI